MRLARAPMAMRMRIIDHQLTASKVTTMEVITIIVLATIVRASLPRRTLLLRCGDVELNPGPVGRYPGNHNQCVYLTLNLRL